MAIVEEKLVSIIMPAYNAENFIEETMISLLNQTYQNWELIVVDDCSNDRTQHIILSYVNQDDRVKYFRLSTNSGAAVARNIGIGKSKGYFIAFLDSDDLWKPDKLSKQIQFMQEYDYHFTCSYYGKINEKSLVLDKHITYKNIADYEELLKNCPGNSTVIYNADILGKFTIPNIRKRNDYVMWLQVIKKSKYLYCCCEELSYHRESSSSLSANKKNLVSYHWKVYREIEKLSLVKSTYLIIYWVIKSLVGKYSVK